MIHLVARMAFALALIAAVALWAKGYTAVGGGFASGATAGLGALLQYVCLDHEHARQVVGARFASRLVGWGTLGALAVVLLPTLWGDAPGTHWPRPSEHVTRVGVVELHTAVLFDLFIALQVYGAFVCAFDRVLPMLEGEAS